MYTAATVGSVRLGRYFSRSSGGGGQSIKGHCQAPIRLALAGRVPRRASVLGTLRVPAERQLSGLPLAAPARQTRQGAYGD